MAPDGMKVALCYIRKSLVRNDKDLISPERQRLAHEAWCATHGFRPEFYTDAEGYRSGRTANREDLQRALAQLGRPEVMSLNFETISRLFRNLRELLILKEECDRRGVALVSLREQFDTSTPIGIFVFQILGALAEMESNMISDRVSSSIEMLRSEKGRFFGIPPMGTMRTEAGKLVPSPDGVWYHPDRVEWSTEEPSGQGWLWRGYHDALQRAYELYASGRYGYAYLAHQLNAEGWRYMSRRYKTPQAWDYGKARSIIVIWRLYAGHLTRGQTVSGGPRDGVIVEDAWEPLLPLELIERAAAVHERKRHDGGGPKPGRRVLYELSGLLHCRACGEKLRGKRQRGRMTTYSHRVTCLKGTKGRPTAPAAEAKARQLLVTYARRIDDDLINRVAAQEAAAFPATDASDKVGKLTTLRRRRQSLVDQSLDGLLDGIVDHASIRAKLADMDGQIGRLEAELGQVPSRAGALAAIAARLRDVDALVSAGDGPALRALYPLVFARFEVEMPGVRLHYRLVESLRELLGEEP